MCWLNPYFCSLEVFRRNKSLGCILDRVDLSDFLEKQSGPLRCDQALHQAKIKIDEGGSEAVAGTAGFICFCSATHPMPLVYSFNCNRPFMFLIHDKINREILFAGVYRGSNQ